MLHYLIIKFAEKKINQIKSNKTFDTTQIYNGKTCLIMTSKFHSFTLSYIAYYKHKMTLPLPPFNINDLIMLGSTLL